MDAIVRIAAYFPFKTITTYFILSNVVINNVGDCATQQRQLLIALLVIFCILHIFACFTDTYTASNGIKSWVFIIPFYGPLCFSLPSDYDKDRVYEHFYLRYRDYSHAFMSVTTFLLIVLFSNPISMCLFPSGSSDGTAKFDAAIIRTVPILVAIIMSMLMVCLGPPRQMLGVQNVQETCPPIERQMGDNPIYNNNNNMNNNNNNNKYGQGEPSMPEGDEEGDEEGGPIPAGKPYGIQRGPGSSRDGTRTPPDMMHGKSSRHPLASPRQSTRMDPSSYNNNEQ